MATRKRNDKQHQQQQRVQTLPTRESLRRAVFSLVSGENHMYPEDISDSDFADAFLDD